MVFSLQIEHVDQLQPHDVASVVSDGLGLSPYSVTITIEAIASSCVSRLVFW